MNQGRFFSLFGLAAFLLQVNVIGHPLRVYILAGQSNMQGSAHKKTFAAIGDDPKTASLLEEILDADGEPVEAHNGWVVCRTNRGGEQVILDGKVKVGYGFDDERIGPEYGFGLYMDRSLEEPVLIIKAAWGGKSLAIDFRPPGAGPYLPSEVEKEKGRVPTQEATGYYYRQMIAFIKETLKDGASIRKVVPEYQESEGYELSGFVWFQGWNDMCNRHHISQYTDNMIHFIVDVRRELESPKLPFIVGVLGVYGTDPESRRFDKGLPVTTFRKTQFEAVEDFDSKVEAKYRGNVISVDSGPFYELGLSDIYWKRRMTGEWKRRLERGEMIREDYQKKCAKYNFGDGEMTPEEQATWERCSSNTEYHYLGSGKTFVRFGKALAEAMLEVQKN